jgi:tetratricopeptide (TPR) repeat protein
MGSITEDLALGLRHHQSGQLAQAEAVYRSILARDPRHADALHLLGVLALQSGQHQSAVDLIGQAIGVSSGQAAYFNHQGIALANLGRNAEAADAFRKARQLAPQMSDVHYNLGNVLRDLGDTEGAIACFRQAVAIRPKYAEALFNLGNALRVAGRLREAVTAFQQAIAARPGYAKALVNLGDTWHDLHDCEQAISAFQQVLALEPNYAKAYNNLGTVYRTQGRQEDAAAQFRRAVELEPQFAEAHNNLGSALLDLKRIDEAIAALQRALDLNPRYAKAMNGLGAAQRALEQIPEAIATFRQTIELDPQLAEAHTNLGSSLQELGQIDEAAACFRRAIELKPESSEAHFGLSTVLLLRGDFAAGWPEYEWRLKGKDQPKRDLRSPLWDGGDLKGRSILLLSEQGMGDTLQFIRYAKIVKERGAIVTLGCPQPLVRLLSTCPYLDRVASELSQEGFDCHAPLMSLPHLLGDTLETIGGEVPYLFADPELIALWRERLADHPGLKVGINWQGNPKYAGDRQRSIPLTQFEPLARVPGVTLVSLQMGFGVEQIAQVADRFTVSTLGDDVDRTRGAFMDTAAVMKCLDLIITSDTATPHLAGALGVPVWMAVPFAPDWRWLLEREDSPWYPTMRLFRQPARGDWDSVFRRLATELASRSGEPSRT